MTDIRKFIEIIEKAGSREPEPKQALTESVSSANNSIRRFVNVVEGKALMEGRHDDLIKQTFDSLAKYRETEDADLSRKVVALLDRYSSDWTKFRQQMNRLNYPNKWKFFVADVMRQSLMLALLDGLGIEDNKLRRKVKMKEIIDGKPSDVVYIMQNLNHFMGIDYPPLQAFDPSSDPDNYLENLTEIEDEWKDAVGDGWITPQGDETLILDLGKYKWFDLGRGACRDEGGAMGHCGNTPSVRAGDTIYSLRQVATRGGQEFHRPSLTFIANNGILGEMKGRANNKPDEKYHPHIIELLKSKYIDGIRGGGYMPQSNFHPDDLTEEQRQEIIDLKGEDFLELTPLIALKKAVKKYNDGEMGAEELIGVANDTIDDLEEEGEIERSFRFRVAGIDEEGRFKVDIEDIVDSVGEFRGYLDGDKYPDVFEVYVNSYQDILDEVNDTLREKVYQHVSQKYRDEIIDSGIIDEDDYTIDAVEENIDEIIEHDIADDLKMAIENVVRGMEESAVMSEIVDGVLEHIKDQLSELGLKIDNIGNVLDDNIGFTTDLYAFVGNLMAFDEIETLDEVDTQNAHWSDSDVDDAADFYLNEFLAGE